MEYKITIAWHKGYWSSDNVFIRQRVEEEVYKCATHPPYEILQKYLDEDSIVGFEVKPWKKEDESLEYSTIMKIGGDWVI